MATSSPHAACPGRPEDDGIRLRALSLGAGVQSTTLALMAAHGEIGPMPDCAIFADTGWEPEAVYRHLEWLMSGNVLPFPVHIVSSGNIRDDLVACANGDPRTALLVNAQSGRAAVRVPTTSVMRDDGSVERRVRLIRPMEHLAVAREEMPRTHWEAVDREQFARAWESELAQVPEFTDSTIHIVSGLLLPIWKRLPTDSPRVYRLQTDSGERIVGRKVTAAWAASATEIGAVTLSPDDALAALIEGRTVLELAEGHQLRRVSVMGAHRLELTGFADTMRDRLKADGLFSEIISWKLRLFVPTDANGAAILAKLLDRFPIERIAEREAA